MKSPICPFDAKSGVLCSRCETKLNSGSLTQDDVYASTKLTRLADRNQDINKFILVRGIKVDSDFVLVLRSSDVLAVRGSNGLANKIEMEFGQKVWFVESEASDRRFIENLFHPLKVLSVNLLWLPDGNKLTRVVVAGSAQKPLVNIEKVQKVAKAVRSIELLIEFERR